MSMVMNIRLTVNETGGPIMYKFILFFLILLSFLPACKRDFSPINEAEISLQPESAGVTDVWLKLTIGKTKAEQGYVVERDGQPIARGNVAGDTVIIDEGLLPNHAYRYRAYINGSNDSESKPVTVTTQDTTSHNFTWEVDTLGEYGSILKDVAIIGENNVWAVGGLNAVTFPNSEFYNAVFWDGFNWNYKGIPFKVDLDSEETVISNLEAIIATELNDIWVSNSAQVVHFDGSGWGNWTNLYDSFNDPTFGGLYHFWAASPIDIWGVGKKGNIFHFDGTNWSRINSGVTVDLHDITGVVDPETGQTRIWVAGELTLLYSDDGETWRVVWDANNPLLPDGFNHPAALQVIDNKTLMIAAWYPQITRGYMFYQKNMNVFKKLFETNLAVKDIGGESINNLLLAGSYSRIGHFNGLKIGEYHELLGDFIFNKVKFKDDYGFIVGRTFSSYQAIIARGIKN